MRYRIFYLPVRGERSVERNRFPFPHPVCPRVIRRASALVLTAGVLCIAFFLAGFLRHRQAERPRFPARSFTSTGTRAEPGMTFIQGGTFLMGANDGFPDEAPRHCVTVPSFWMDTRAVTVAEFARFAQATGYRTDAECIGWASVFDVRTGGWTVSEGANWRHPDGPQALPRSDEPVTQVSWNDAIAYARWAGKRLPTEAEFEVAARGGLVAKKYAWGDTLRPDGRYRANYWQGAFPARDTGADGYVGRAPVGQFPPNGYGLYDMTGNVWEWCADRYDAHYYAHSPQKSPRGPAEGTERVLRGGSWLCAENCCAGYRVSARSHAPPDTGLNNLGFRCVKAE